MKIYGVLKRILDLVLAVLMLAMLFPLLVVAAIAIKLDSRGPVFFTQDRLGIDGMVFKIFKFRSMAVGAERSGTGVYSFDGDPRVTKVGSIMRKTSIDELPQLINILKGEMSFIGPRPTLTYHPWSLEEYTKEQKRRFSVLPGVTGWAQVNGRKDVPWDKRIMLDLEYVDRLSFGFDAKIFFMTVTKVLLMKDNINVSQTVTAKATEVDSGEGG